jgi:hypothetical protein
MALPRSRRRLARGCAVERGPAHRVRARLRLGAVHGTRVRQRGVRPNTAGSFARQAAARPRHLPGVPGDARARAGRGARGDRRRAGPGPDSRRPRCGARALLTGGALSATGRVRRAVGHRARGARTGAGRGQPARCLAQDRPARGNRVRSRGTCRAATAARCRNRARALRHLPRRRADRAPPSRSRADGGAAPDRLQRPDPEPRDRVHRAGLARPPRRALRVAAAAARASPGLARSAGYMPAAVHSDSQGIYRLVRLEREATEGAA